MLGVPPAGSGDIQSNLLAALGVDVAPASTLRTLTVEGALTVLQRAPPEVTGFAVEESTVALPQQIGSQATAWSDAVPVAGGLVFAVLDSSGASPGLSVPTIADLLRARASAVATFTVVVPIAQGVNDMAGPGMVALASLAGESSADSQLVATWEAIATAVNQPETAGWLTYDVQGLESTSRTVGASAEPLVRTISSSESQTTTTMSDTRHGEIKLERVPIERAPLAPWPGPRWPGPPWPNHVGRLLHAANNLARAATTSSRPPDVHVAAYDVDDASSPQAESTLIKRRNDLATAIHLQEEAKIAQDASVWRERLEGASHGVSKKADE